MKRKKKFLIFIQTFGFFFGLFSTLSFFYLQSHLLLVFFLTMKPTAVALGQHRAFSSSS
jgi:hypothetical protein